MKRLFALLAIASFPVLAGGCSAYDLEAYLARDSEGNRETTCFRPEWREMWLFAEILSLRDNQFLIPELIQTDDEGGVDDDKQFIYGDQSLAEFGNIAVEVNTETTLTLQFDSVLRNPPADGASEEVDFPRGNYTLNLYMEDDEFIEDGDSPAASIDFRVSDECPCRPYPQCDAPSGAQ